MRKNISFLAPFFFLIIGAFGVGFMVGKSQKVSLVKEGFSPNSLFSHGDVVYDLYDELETAYTSNYFVSMLDKETGKVTHVIPKVRISEASARFKSVFCQPLIVPACFDCNQVKGSKSLVEFREYLKANWVRNRYLILQNLKHLIQ